MVELLTQTPDYNERKGIVSPDGRWLAYDSDESGRFQIYVRPYPNINAGQRVFSVADGWKPLWARNGEELFYLALDGTLMAVPVDARNGSFSAGNPRKIVDGPYFTQNPESGRNYDVSLDGRRFLMLKKPPANPATTPQIVMVQHWLDELRRLVPPKP